MSARPVSTLVAAALLLGGVSVLSLSACSGPGSSSSSQVAAQVTLAVEGMVCESCEEAITAQLVAIDGVESATLSHTEKSAVVLYDPGKTSVAAIIAAIEKLGYKASE